MIRTSFINMIRRTINGGRLTPVIAAIELSRIPASSLSKVLFELVLSKLGTRGVLVEDAYKPEVEDRARWLTDCLADHVPVIAAARDTGDIQPAIDRGFTQLLLPQVSPAEPDLLKKWRHRYVGSIQPDIGVTYWGLPLNFWRREVINDHQDFMVLKPRAIHELPVFKENARPRCRWTSPGAPLIFMDFRLAEGYYSAEVLAAYIKAIFGPLGGVDGVIVSPNAFSPAERPGSAMAKVEDMISHARKWRRGSSPEFFPTEPLRHEESAEVTGEPPRLR